MRIAATSFVLLLASSLCFADVKPESFLDKITFQVTAKQWVNTQTALLAVNINVTLNDADLAKARADIMDKLEMIAKSTWHLVEFNRSQDSSGLEKLTVRAQARVEQQILTEVYKKAKSVSQPGANYEVAAIEFKPSLGEVQKAKAELRQTLYQKAKTEMTRINQTFNKQRYSVFKLFFVEGDKPPQPKAYRNQETVSLMAISNTAPDLTVGNELVMTAVVQAASNRFQPEVNGD